MPKYLMLSTLSEQGLQTRGSDGVGERVATLWRDQIAGELQAAFARVGIQAFSPKGEVFDPNEHEAMAHAPIEGVESGTVAEV